MPKMTRQRNVDQWSTKPAPFHRPWCLTPLDMCGTSANPSPTTPTATGVQEFKTPMAAHIETALRNGCHLAPCLTPRSRTAPGWSRHPHVVKNVRPQALSRPIGQQIAGHSSWERRPRRSNRTLSIPTGRSLFGPTLKGANSARPHRKPPANQRAPRSSRPARDPWLASHNRGIARQRGSHLESILLPRKPTRRSFRGTHDGWVGRKADPVEPEVANTSELCDGASRPPPRCGIPASCNVRRAPLQHRVGVLQ